MKQLLFDVLKISRHFEKKSSRKDLLDFFKSKEINNNSENAASLKKIAFDKTAFDKIAFDTRNISPYEYNPRRNLQNFMRSESFISQSKDKLETFLKLKPILDKINEDFYTDNYYLDSYARILKNAIDKTLRINQNDKDFSDKDIDYLEQLIYNRYRITLENINKMSEKELREIILSKDENLMNKNIIKITNKEEKPIVKSDDLIEKLFGNVKATAENKNVERSITITINDKIKE